MGVKTLRYKWTLRGINRINAFAASGKIMQRVIAVLAALTTAGLSACVQTPAAPASCPARENAAAEVAQTMRDMYAAVKTDDYAGFHAAVTSDFFAFDVGTRFDGDALMDLIKAQHEKRLRLRMADKRSEGGGDLRHGAGHIHQHRLGDVKRREARVVVARIRNPEA